MLSSSQKSLFLSLYQVQDEVGYLKEGKERIQCEFSVRSQLLHITYCSNIIKTHEIFGLFSKIEITIII